MAGVPMEHREKRRCRASPGSEGRCPISHLTRGVEPGPNETAIVRQIREEVVARRRIGGHHLALSSHARREPSVEMGEPTREPESSGSAGEVELVGDQSVPCHLPHRREHFVAKWMWVPVRCQGSRLRRVLRNLPHTPAPQVVWAGADRVLERVEGRFVPDVEDLVPHLPHLARSRSCPPVSCPGADYMS